MSEVGLPLHLTPYIKANRIPEARDRAQVRGLQWPGLVSYAGFLTVNQGEHKIFILAMIITCLLLQWAPLNGITLGPRQTDLINRMIPLTDTHIALLRSNRHWIP